MFRMDKIMKKLFYILSAAAVMATACVRESVPEQEQESVLTTSVAPKEGDMMLVTFALSIPEAELVAAQTRLQNFDDWEAPEQSRRTKCMLPSSAAAAATAEAVTSRTL